jgi:hypothetical protein
VASRHDRLVSYPVTGSFDGLAFDLDEGNIAVVGGGRRDAVEVRRTERSSFGHNAITRRAVSGGFFRVRSRCPTTLLGPCGVDYRVVVPDNVAVHIRTSGGQVSFRGYRGSALVTTGGGGIDISGYCGNSFDARAGGGDITFDAACAPPRLSLRSTSGAIRAVLPVGRYDIDAESSSGDEHVRGLTSRPDAPYSVQALSGSGDVAVEARP